MYYIYIHNCLPSLIDLMLLLYPFEKNNVLLYQSLHFMMFIKSKSRSRRLSQHAQLPIVHIPLDAHHLGPFGICDTTPPAPVLQSNQVRVTLINQSPTNRTHHPIFPPYNRISLIFVQRAAHCLAIISAHLIRNKMYRFNRLLYLIFSTHRAILRLTVLWGASGIAAGSPLTTDSYFGAHFYGNNGVCLSLHIHDPYAQVLMTKLILYVYLYLTLLTYMWMCLEWGRSWLESIRFFVYI